MQIFSQDLLLSLLSTKTSGLVKFEIIPTPIDATVTLTATGYVQSGNYIEVPIGTQVTYSVAKTSYTTISDTVTVIGAANKEITLSQKPQYNFTVVPVPDDALVSINGSSGITTKAIYEGDDASYAVSHDGMQSVTGVMQDIRESTSVNVTLTAKLTVNPVKTVGGQQVADTDAIITWSTATQATNGSHEKTVELPVNTTASYSVARPGYITATGSFPISGNYLVNSSINVELNKEALTFSVAATPADAVISISVNGGAASTGSGTVTATCYIGDIITWSVTKTGYTAASGTYTMTDVSHTESVSIDVASVAVNVTATPAIAVITMTRASDGRVWTGTGSLVASANSGDVVTITATAGGTTETTGSVTLTGDSYVHSFVLSPTATEVTMINSTQTITVPYGKYRVLLVGAGGGGGATRMAASSSSKTATGSAGGGGGGSGQVLYSYFTVSNPAGEAILFTVGTGGTPGTAGVSQTALLGGNGGNTSFECNGTTLQALGGLGGGYPAYGNTGSGNAGGAGGSGGGAGGYGGTRTSSTTNNPVAGQNGGISGSNGKDCVYVSYGTTYSSLGGEGVFGTWSEAYESNAGGLANYTNYGIAGTKGRGLNRLQSSLLTVAGLTGTDVQTLYASLSGGGGGGPSKLPSINVTLSGNWYGGPGAGGGGWNDGTDGTNTANTACVPGTGGNGAILFCRIAWE